MIDRLNDDRASEGAANLLLRIGVATAFIATPVFQLVSQRAIFILPPIAAALILAAGMALAPRLNLREILALLPTRVGLAASFLAFWMLLSLLWTPFPAEAAPRLVKALLTLLAVLPVAASLPARTRAANLYFLPLGVAATAVATLILTAFPPPDDVEIGAPDNLAIGMEAALLLLWPALAATHLRKRASLSASLVIVVIAAAVSVPVPGALFAAALAALVVALAFRDARRVGRWAGRNGAVCFLLAPLIPLLLNLKAGPDAAPWLQSLKIWRWLVVNDGLRIFTGHGFNFVSSGFWRGYLPVLAPRNMLFEIWTDLGLIGAVAAAVLTRVAFKAAA
ncbi:MAG TPA: hypothetical protein VMU18_04245, partial [Rhodoblastus sp.]|nr:hypothetical protein [Rhodoblastus sp.]